MIIGSGKRGDIAVRSTRETWGAVSRWLHWISAVLVIVGLGYGIWVADFAPRPDGLWHRALHSLILFHVILLLLVRIAWRVGVI